MRVATGAAAAVLASSCVAVACGLAVPSRVGISSRCVTHLDAARTHALACCETVPFEADDALLGDELSAAEAARLIGAGDATVLDVRLEGEWRLDGHIAGNASTHPHSTHPSSPPPPPPPLPPPPQPHPHPHPHSHPQAPCVCRVTHGSTASTCRETSLSTTSTSGSACWVSHAVALCCFAAATARVRVRRARCSATLDLGASPRFVEACKNGALKTSR